MKEELLTFVIIGDENNDLDGSCYKSFNNDSKQHIDALFDTYNYFYNKEYFITLFKPFKSITSFIEMVTLNGHVVYINMFNNEGILFIPDYLTDKQRESLFAELNNLKDINIKVSINMNALCDLSEISFNSKKVSKKTL